jgi:hypothetical protein
MEGLKLLIIFLLQLKDHIINVILDPFLTILPSLTGGFFIYHPIVGFVILVV